jgi:hypothetical protein
MYATAVLVAACALLLFALAVVVYVAYRFLSLALVVDAAILSELRSRSVQPSQLAADPATHETLLGSQLKQFIAERMKPTDGGYEVNSDEELYIQEQVKRLRDQGNGGLTDEELKSFISQAVSEEKG